MNICFDFDENTLNALEKVYEAAFLSKTKIYFVGGMVRDALMDVAIADIDILIAGSAIDFSSTIKDIEIKSIHKDFNTVKAVLDGITIDFASTRKETYPSSGCLPVVSETGIAVEDDLKRRDFTVNSIAAEIIKTKKGIEYKVFDPYNGMQDIKNKVLKVLHNNSFIDDPTRILRGVDFRFRFGFEFDKKTKELMKKYLDKPNRSGLSIDRVRLSAKKIYSNSLTAEDACKYVITNNCYKIWTDKVDVKIDTVLRVKKAAEIFKIQNGDSLAELYCEIFKFSDFAYPPYCEIDDANHKIYDFFKKFSDVQLALYYIKNKDEKTIKYFKELKNIKPLINGDDLLSLGVKEGKKIGKILNKILIEKLNCPESFKKRKDELDLARTLID